MKNKKLLLLYLNCNLSELYKDKIKFQLDKKTLFKTTRLNQDIYNKELLLNYNN